MYKKTCLLASYPFQEFARAGPVPFEALEFAHHPSPQRLIDVTIDRGESRWCVAPVVPHPAPKDWIELACNSDHRHVCSTPYIQVPDRFPHCL